MTDLLEADVAAERAKGCGLTFIIFLALAASLLTLFVGYPVYKLFVEKHVLRVDKSPNGTYRVTAVRYGDMTYWGGDVYSSVTLKEARTRAKIKIGTTYNNDGVAQLSIIWSSDDHALITTNGGANKTYQYEFNSREKQFKQVKNDHH
ncbi:hypothetical protein [Pseudolactococcus reticulitermitis]|uniref:Uncharacterized protein n=1 Tax=Pseudolactococcus reticulitermitis TaxID=2025039 RepID=A0A224XAS7_9LACT|nr:hypothetical protein [Lactococcus reticulitermitis]GAX48360.1 hypothetical protein RsY01_1981 [Lactococcus reticulitermitis]